MKINTVKILILLSLIWTQFAFSQEQATSEGFDDITDLTGWEFSNNSVPLGDSNWFQGQNSFDTFPAFSGESSSYIAANHRNTLGTPEENGTICNFMIMPNLGLLESVSFHTRSRNAANNVNIYPDRLYMVYSPSGEINTGNCTDGFGDFTETLIEINPELSQLNYPVGYPLVNWLQFTAEINGNGRIAFVYYVPDAGFYGENSNYIGIDSVEWVFGNNIPVSEPKFQVGLNYDPEHSGHGFSIENVGEDLFYTVFYTYANDSYPEWFADLGVFQEPSLNYWNITTNGNQFINYHYDYENNMAYQNQDDEYLGKINHDKCSDEDGEISLDFEIGIDSLGMPLSQGRWCSDSIVDQSQKPQNDLSGLWWAGGEDSGWGWSVSLVEREETTDIVIVLYYYDGDGNPRWLMGQTSDFEAGVEISLNMNMVKGYARDASPSALEFIPAGTLSITLNQASNDINSNAGSMSIDVTYPGAEGGSWIRNNIPIALFSTPRD